MAEAVEKAIVVIVCLTQKYKESPNCRTGRLLRDSIVSYIPFYKQIVEQRLSANYLTTYIHPCSISRLIAETEPADVVSDPVHCSLL